MSSLNSKPFLYSPSAFYSIIVHSLLPVLFLLGETLLVATTGRARWHNVNGVELLIPIVQLTFVVIPAGGGVVRLHLSILMN